MCSLLPLSGYRMLLQDRSMPSRAVTDHELLPCRRGGAGAAGGDRWLVQRECQH